MSIINQFVPCIVLCRYGDGKKLLLHALCNKFEVRVAGQSRMIKDVVPLVCDQVWALILSSYPHSQLKVLVEQNRPTAVLRKKSSTLCIMGKTTCNTNAKNAKYLSSLFLHAYIGVPEQIMRCFSLGLELVMEDEPSERTLRETKWGSCQCNLSTCRCNAVSIGLPFGHC